MVPSISQAAGERRLANAPIALTDEVVSGKDVYFGNEGKAAPIGSDLEEAFFTATVNGVHGDQLVTLFKDAVDQVYVTADQLEAWRIKARRLPSIVRDEVRYYLVNAVSGVRVGINPASQELKLTVPSTELELTRLSYAPVALTDKVVSGKGVYLNYDVNGQAVGKDKSVAAAFETVVFTPSGVGNSGFIGKWDNTGAELVRTETSWTIDDVEKMRSLRLGDSISRGGVGGAPVRFAGFQIARNFAVQPGYLTMPLPSVKGSAQLPSAADLYVNDVLVHTSELPPGPFDITNIPIVTGSGDVQLVVRDLLGRQQLVSQSYYASSSQLRKGLDDYSYEAGFLRRDFGTQSNDYGPAFFSGTHRYGFTDWLTAEAHLEASPQVQAGGLGASVVVPGVGHLEGSIAGSHSGRGDGVSGTLTFERQTHGLSLGAHAELSSKNYMSLGAPSGSEPPSVILQAFAGVPFHDGSIGFSYLLRESRTEPSVQFASTNLSLRLGRLGSLNLAARKSLEGPRNDQAELVLIIPFGRETTASLGGTLENGGEIINALLQRSLPVGNGLGYRFNASTGRFEQVQGEVTLRTDFGDFDGMLTWTDGSTGVRLSTTGSIGIIGGTVFASRHLDQSFAEVKVGQYRGVRVYADNQLIGHTSSSGSLIVPNLRDFDRNNIRIEANDLPLDAELTSERQIVRPAGRQGVVVDFKARPSHALIIRVQLKDGHLLPTGSSVTLEGRSDEFVSAPGGEIYVTDLDHKQLGIARWATGACQFVAPVATSAQTTVQCVPISQ